ncbi:TetR/AcrR family transcriptional regulator [Frankia sp. AgB1.9]|nr:TetR/AcrR family transcriptional regulator [Frankia sp. AgW1.1]MBL7550826.1 TetR/AcrR family transcriptional regulator [Frankia sp. AgB1.9]MBL7625147.1 TetR/AcrR family transcriptional regulator [Frankia sp. AgB1.8]
MAHAAADGQGVRANEEAGRVDGRKGGLRAAQKARTHARFIDAAVTEFAELGYARTKVDDIVARSGSTRATFYLHFRSKADILRELYERVMMAFTGIYDDFGAIARNPTIEGIEAWIRTDVERWGSIRHDVAALAEGAVIDPEIRDMVEQGYDDHVKFLAAALLTAHEGLDPVDAEYTAAILYMPLMHFFERYVYGRLADPDRMISVLASAWMAVIKNAGAANQ